MSQDTAMTPALSLLWDRVLKDLQDKLDDESFKTWIMPVECTSIEDDEISLGVPTLFFRNWIINNFQELIVESFSEHLRREITIRYTIGLRDVEEPEHPVPASDAVNLSPAEKQAIEVFRRSRHVDRPTELISVPLNRNYNFDTFVVGESNRFAHAAAQAVADPQSKVYNPLFIYGGVGLGKTHLMQAIGEQLQSYGKHFNVLYVSSEAFMNAFIESVAQKKLSEFRNCFRNVDLLLVDDVQFFSGAEQTQTEFFHTFNILYDAGKKIVLSSDHPPKELTYLEERLRSRFEWGLLVDIQAPDLETRVAILRKKARAMGLNLPDEVTILVAERIRTNLRKLEGSLTRLAAHTNMTKQPITTDLARQLLGPLIAGDEPRKISVETVQMTICDYFDLSLHELTGPNRSQKLSRPRHIACYLCRELTESSYPDIARKFGGRDHSSIIHAHKKVATDMATDLGKQNLIKSLIKRIKSEANSERRSR
jgi:chromosomal replication initiator protein